MLYLPSFVNTPANSEFCSPNGDLVLTAKASSLNPNNSFFRGKNNRNEESLLKKSQRFQK